MLCFLTAYTSTLVTYLPTFTLLSCQSLAFPIRTFRGVTFGDQVRKNGNGAVFRADLNLLRVFAIGVDPHFVCTVD